MQIIFSGRTDVGLRRKNNEDAYVARADLNFFTVADGMGGSAAGEIASGIFVETAEEIFEKADSSDEKTAVVQEVFRVANERILKSAEEHPEYRGMGCTAELIAFNGERYIVGHVGDSRSYLFRDGELRQITRDHSLVQEQLDQGLISSEEAKTHRLKNIVLRAVGIEHAVALDLVQGRAMAGDIFLLCSDGLTDMVADDFIQKIVASGRSVAEISLELIEAAKSGGGNDNITVLLCQVSA